MRILAALLPLLITSTAAADAYPPPPSFATAAPPTNPTPQLPASVEPRPRTGLTFGIGLSVGSLVADCAECNATFEAGGLHTHIGLMISPRLAVIAEAWAMAHTDGFLTVYQNLTTLGARAWLTPKLWVQGGVGAATAGYSWHGIFVDREARTESSPGVTAAAGYELALRRNLVLDLQLRAGTGFYSKDPVDGYVVEGHSVGLGAGFAWY